MKRLLEELLTPLRPFFEAVFTPLNGMLAAIPFEAARWVTCGFLLLSIVGVMLLKRDYIFLGAREEKWYLDLRLWTVVFVLPYVLIYLLL